MPAQNYNAQYNKVPPIRQGSCFLIASNQIIWGTDVTHTAQDLDVVQFVVHIGLLNVSTVLFFFFKQLMPQLVISKME